MNSTDTPIQRREAMSQFLDRLMKVSRFAAEWRINFNALKVVLYLRENCPTRIGEICDITGISPSNMSRTIDTLMRRGFIVLNVDRADRRCTVISLTKLCEAKARDL